MPNPLKRQQLGEAIRHCIDIYLSQNLDWWGFSHVIDVNMSEDLKVAHVYISSELEKDEEKLLNKITADNQEIVGIFKENFRSRYIPKLKFVFTRPVKYLDNLE